MVDRQIRIGVETDTRELDTLAQRMQNLAQVSSAVFSQLDADSKRALGFFEGLGQKLAPSRTVVDLKNNIAKLSYTFSQTTNDGVELTTTVQRFGSVALQTSESIEAGTRALNENTAAVQRNKNAITAAETEKTRAASNYRRLPANVEADRLARQAQQIDERIASIPERLARPGAQVYLPTISGSISREKAPEVALEVERRLTEEARRLRAESENIRTTDASILAGKDRMIAAEKELTRLKSEQKRLGQEEALIRERFLQGSIAPIAQNPYTRRVPENAKNILRDAGLDVDNPVRFLQQTDKSVGGFFNPITDAATGITRLSAAFRDHEGALNKITLKWDAADNVLTTLGNRIQSTFRILGTGAGAVGAVNNISRTLDPLLAAEQAIGRRELQSQIADLSPVSNPNLVGPNVPYISGASTAYDSLNDVLRTNYEVSIKSADGQTHLLTTIDKYRDVTAVVPELERLAQVQRDIATSANTAQLAVDRAQKELDEYRASTIRPLQEKLSLAEISGETLAGADVRDEAAIAANQELQRSLREQIASDTEIIRLENQHTAALENQSRVHAENNALLTAQQNRIENTLQSSRLQAPRQIQALASQSPQLYEQFRKQGLADLTDSEGLYRQGADSLKIVKDLDLGINKVTATITKETGEVVRLTGAFRDGGAIVTSFGRQMSGLSNYLRQTKDDFIKLTQWMTATAVLFTGFSVIRTALTDLGQFDQQLKRLSITSEATNQEVGSLFNQLTTIAIGTATPIKELVVAADDMALATKRANQSTSEWRQSFVDLANATGILTNISGLGTESAVDKLTSIMKQLNLEADELVGVLNKITAVAGGQSGAIADITTGLGSMAEAAQEANLTLDQSIAVLQVLGQVTAKSSAEIATSFKNLTGSLGSPGAKKVFEKYSIDVKDAEGNLRNIIDIYSEINEKIQRGIIAPGDVQGVLRGISGGPRRLPDAAALLSNIGRINEVAAESVNATNEALLANAKILDTIPAKVTQIQTAFQAFIQSNFGDAFRQIVDTIVDIGTGLLHIGESIPTGAYTGLLTIIPAFALLKVGTIAVAGAMSIFGGAAAQATRVTGLLTGATAGLSREQSVAARSADAHINAINAETAAYEKQVNVIAKSRNAFSSRSAAIGRGLGGAALGAITTIGANAATGQGFQPISTFQNASLFGGTALLGTPLAPLGAGLIAASIGSQILGFKDEQQPEEMRASAQDILQAVNAYKEASQAVKDLNVQQAQNLNLIRAAGDDIGATISAVQNYGEAVRASIEANKAFEESFNSLLALDPKIQADYGKKLVLARAGAFDDKALDALSEELSSKLAESFYPDFTSLEKLGRSPAAPGTIEVIPPEVTARLDEYKSKLSEIQNSEQGGAVLRAERQKQLNEEYADALKYLDQYNTRLVGLSTQTQRFAQFQSTRLLSEQYIGRVTPEEFSAGQANLKTYTAFLDEIDDKSRAAFRAGPLEFIKYATQAQNVLSVLRENLTDTEGNILTGDIPINDVREILEATGQLETLRKQGVEITDAVVSTLGRALGLSVELVGAARANAEAQELTKGQLQSIIELEQERLSILTKVIQAASQQGTEGYADQLNQVSAVKTESERFLNFLVTSARGLDGYRIALSGVIGLEQLAAEGADGYAIAEDKVGKAIADHFSAFNLSSGAIQKHTRDLIEVAKSYDVLLEARDKNNRIQARVTTSADINDLQALETALEELGLAEKAYADATEEANRSLLSSVFAHPESMFAESLYREFQDTLGETGDKAIEAFNNMTPDERVQTLTVFLDDVSTGVIRLTNVQGLLAPALDASNRALQEQTDRMGTLASTTADLYARLLQGDFAQNPDQFQFGLDQANATSQSREQLYRALSDLDDVGRLRSLEEQLKSIPGLQDAVGLSAEQLTIRLITLFEKFGLSGSQITASGDAIIQWAEAALKAKTASDDLLGVLPPGQLRLPTFEQSQFQYNLIGSVTQDPGSAKAQGLYREYLAQFSQESAQAFANLDLEGRTAATKKFFDNWKNGIIDVVNGYDLLNTAIGKIYTQEQLDQGEKSALADLAKKRRDLDAEIRGLEVQRDRIRVRPGDETDADSKGRKIENKTSDIDARIAALKEQREQTIALIDAQSGLGDSLSSLNEQYGSTAIDEFIDKLSQIPGLEDASSVGAEGLYGWLISLAGQFGLTGKQVTELYTKLEALLKLMAVLDGLKAQMKVEIQVATTTLEAGAANASTIAPGRAGTNEQDLINISRGAPLPGTAASNVKSVEKQIEDGFKGVGDTLSDGIGRAFGTPDPAVGGSGGGSKSKEEDKLNYTMRDLDETIKKSQQLGYTTRQQDINTLQQYIDKIESQLPKEELEKIKNDRVILFDGLEKIATFNTSSEILSRAMKELADIEKKRLEFETKADTIRRIRIGSGDFAAIANVPYNSKAGVSVGGSNAPITVNLNINGAVLTPAQAARVGDMLASEIKRSYAASS